MSLPSRVSNADRAPALRWGVVGLGLAGRARARAIQADPRARLALAFRGRPEDLGLPRAETLADLLGQVDAVAICSPDVTHPDLVRTALAAGRHVLCEFPLAGTTKVARELFAQARRCGRVLHVEHIELLDAPGRVLREVLLGRRLRGGSIRFVGARRRGIYGIAHANLARLSRLVDAAGLPEAVRVEARGPRFLKGLVRFADGVEIRLDFRQDDGQPRRTEIQLDTDRGSLSLCDGVLQVDGAEAAVPKGPGLFVQDQLVASARILDGAASYVDEDRVVDLISLADALVRASPGGDWIGFQPGSRLPFTDELDTDLEPEDEPDLDEQR